jgi:hypothetical protein
MKKEEFLYKNVGLIGLLFIFIILIVVSSGNKPTGNVVSNEEHAFGPSATDQACMMQCMGCSSPGVGCTGNQQECQTACNVQKPEQTSEEKCVETCAMKGCEQFDFSCQQKNQAVCDKECGIIKEPETKSEEEQCIRDCVNAENPGLICQAGEGGEQGNAICQRCAKSCEHLYSGPCLTEIKLEEAKSACNTCEHCYGKPVMGDSGEGYECIVSIECADASGEFGNNSGTGEGIVSKAGETIGNVIESIGNFFSGIFGRGNEE